MTVIWWLGTCVLFKRFYSLLSLVYHNPEDQSMNLDTYENLKFCVGKNR